MHREFTPAVERVLAEAARWSWDGRSGELLAPALLLGLLAETECKAAMILAREGVEAADVCRQWPCLVRQEWEVCIPPFSVEVEATLTLASRRLRDLPQPLVLATEHLLLGLAVAEHDTGVWLRQQGLHPVRLLDEILQQYGVAAGALPYGEDGKVAGTLRMPCPVAPGEPEAPNDPPLVAAGPSARTMDAPSVDGTAAPPQAAAAPRAAAAPQAAVGVLRVVDAAGNRAREGLRVVEDFARFVLDDRHLTGCLKGLRHELTAALSAVSPADRLAARETEADVGTGLTAPAEAERGDVAGVVAANFGRIQEALRSLEEFGKLLDPQAAGRIKQLRYRTYTLQRAVSITRASLARLGHARLYVLVDGRPSVEEFEALVRSLVAVGVDVLQLRDKTLDDRRLLERARRMRELTAGTGTRMVVNDRPDLAALAGADGVHVGQEELSVKDARAIVGPGALVGVSTHSIAQARRAVLDGADYLGVGPTFPSGTKSFDHFPGLELVRAVAAEIRLPAFAIGGITRENLAEVLGAGLGRVAVSGAVAASTDPAAAARTLRAMLQ